ncbi:Hypothetical predicted protein [Scomber scombrus]|uniref:Uncharacterized protein n=1 Tax=Scomber scombrus TaxID=13677 RepID=A0AAV1NLR1_SCOSC
MKDDGQEYKHQGQDIKTNLRGLTHFNSQRLTRELTDSSPTSVCFQYFSAVKNKNLRKNNNGTQGTVYHVNLDHRILRFIPSTFANHQCLAPIISILSEEFEIISRSASSDKDRRTNLLCRKALTGHLTVSYNRHKP